jgi:hypothetical protein
MASADLIDEEISTSHHGNGAMGRADEAPLLILQADDEFDWEAYM